jgi:hypothetical protein
MQKRRWLVVVAGNASVERLASAFDAQSLPAAVPAADRTCWRSSACDASATCCLGLLQGRRARLVTAGSPASASARVRDARLAPEDLTDNASISSDSQELRHLPHTLTQLLGSP